MSKWRRRWRRLRGTIGIGWYRVLGQLRTPGPKRIALSIFGVVLAVALMVSVTGVAVGLASQSAVQSDGVDYWIVPEGGSVNSISVSMQGPKLGRVHALTDRVRENERVSFATPVLIQILPLQPQSSETREYILLLGVIPPSEQAVDDHRIAGLSTGSLTVGDPYYAGGSYNGTWTGELVASRAAAELLNVSQGSSVNVQGRTDYTFTVVNASGSGINTGLGPAPVAVVHLSELQAITGAATGDQADQLLVSTNTPAVRSELEQLYPRTEVITRTGFSGQEVSTSSLPLAMALAAFVIATVIGALFVTTMMALEITADQTQLAVLWALGYSGRSRSLLVFAEIIVLSIIGGIGGVILGTGGIIATNMASRQFLNAGPIAVFEPVLVIYGIGVAILIGIIATPYPLVLAYNTDPIRVIER